ncbi:MULTISPECIES: hypothetical protein [Lysinibacillus]|uniref:hypothetical protein n=1 Tax=Lysinibacillus TaxID=400634 RepID=UPI00214BA382|nr:MULTISPECIES: hypothetical protein [Lysinibacillus]UUV25926.1 hypothetical protein NP781_04720 [Lysinibacillus sp. FN11]UYB48799.1 hypothetical protein OCI51_07510 [Lysinibacillus capsici]
MMKVWQCSKVEYHTMVRPVTRCTLCGSSVEEKVLEDKSENGDLIQDIKDAIDLDYWGSL